MFDVPPRAAPLPWSEIDTVLLDLDGTLLDLAFDSYIWLVRVPELYAAANALTLAEATSRLAPRFRDFEGTLDWYCVDFWTRELGLDVRALHREEQARIGWLPGARDFLARLRTARKRLVLLTNSHPAILAIKDQRTCVREWFDAAHSSHDFGAPKEDARFWERIAAHEPFDPQRTLFVDDSIAVLRAAQAAGIRWIYRVRCPDSTRAPATQPEFPAVDAVAELMRG